MRTFPLLLLQLATVAAGKWLNGRPPGGLVNAPLHRLQSRADTLFPGQTLTNFSQKFDHFDPLDERRWNQRMYYNPIHANRELAGGQDIVFLMIGGEGRESARWTGDDNVMIMQYAKQFGATVFDLEHRFFGDSRPINDMKSSSLQYLTTEQAMADLAYFINVMNKEHGFLNPKWIPFGGSYPGALCAMFRSKYPELTAGAVCSSAPLVLSLDFYQYAGVIEYVLKSTPIQNKQNLGCDELVRQSFDTMQQLSLTADGRGTLNEKLRLDPPFDNTTTKPDITNFFSNLYTAHQGMIQYTYDGSSDKTKTYATASQLCRIYNQDQDMLDNVWDHLVWYNQYWNGVNITTFDNSYEEMIKASLQFEVSETDYDKLGDGGNEARGWMWLCCNEMGWLQTTDTDTIFGSTLPMNFFFDMCTDMFGYAMTAPLIRDNNKAAQAFYGGFYDFDATNLCMPNGKFDPWSSLGYYNADKARNIVPVVIEGAAHCSDMYPPYEGEPAGLPAARDQIRAFLYGIIYDAAHPKPTPAPSPEPTTDGTLTTSEDASSYTSSSPSTTTSTKPTTTTSLAVDVSLVSTITLTLALVIH